MSLSECISSCSLPTSTFPKPGLVLYVLCITVDIRRSGAVLSIVVASAASVLWRLRIWFLEIQEFSLSTPEILSPWLSHLYVVHSSGMIRERNPKDFWKEIPKWTHFPPLSIYPCHPSFTRCPSFVSFCLSFSDKCLHLSWRSLTPNVWKLYFRCSKMNRASGRFQNAYFQISFQVQKWQSKSLFALFGQRGVRVDGDKCHAQ